jgi:hypothetical protein
VFDEEDHLVVIAELPGVEALHKLMVSEDAASAAAPAEAPADPGPPALLRPTRVFRF